MKIRTGILGETRIVRGFAFLPVRCDDGVIVWLGRYWRLERYGMYSRHDGRSNGYAWIPKEWYSEKPKENP